VKEIVERMPEYIFDESALVQLLRGVTSFLALLSDIVEVC